MRMKKIISILFIVAIVTFAQAQNHILKGKGNLDMIYGSEHKDWFEKNYSEAILDEITVQSFPQNIECNFKILIVLGTWCSDSRKQVPHFFKILDYWHIKPTVELLFVDEAKNSKVKGYKKLRINYVPTFIIYNTKGKEIDRIVETPKVSLEKDLKTILDITNIHLP